MALLHDLWMPSDIWDDTGPVWPSIEADNFELRLGLIALVQQNQFRGLPTEDPQEHIRIVLEYANTVQYHQVSPDAIRCMLFTFSLRDGAKDWYHSLPSREFSWSEISQAFLERYFPLHKQSAIRDQIFSFAQSGSESLYEAWERYKGLLRRCPNHGLERWLEVQIFYRGLTCDSRSLIDMSAEGSIMNKTVDDAILLIESLAFHQLQWYSKQPGVTSWNQSVAATNGEQQAPCTMEISQSTPMSLIDKGSSDNHQIAFCGQQHLRSKSDSPCDKIELERIMYDDDDDIIQENATIVQMENTFPDATVDGILDESKLQEVNDEQLTPIEAKPREQDMEKYTCVTQLCDLWNSAFSPIVHTCVIAASKLFDKKRSSVPLVVAPCVTIEKDIPQKYSEAEICTSVQDHVSEGLPKEKFMIPELGCSSRIDIDTSEDESEKVQITHDEEGTSKEIEGRVITGSSKPLVDIVPHDVSVPTLRTILPSLKVELRIYLRGIDDIYPARNVADISHADTHRSHTLPGRNANMIRYSTDGLEGVDPVTCKCCFSKWIFRILLVYHPLRLNNVRVDIPWDPGGFMEW